MPDEANTNANTQAQTSSSTVTVDLDKTLARMKEKAGGDMDRLCKSLIRDNYKHRETVRDIQSKLPGEGSRVLTADEAKVYESYRKLGDDPKALAGELQSGREAVTWKTGYERDQAYTKAAEAEKFNAPLLKVLAKADGLNVVVKEVDANGKKVSKAFVVDDKNAETPLADYANARWAEHLPLLGGQKDERRPNGMPVRPTDTLPPPRPGESQNFSPESYVAGQSRYRSL